MLGRPGRRPGFDRGHVEAGGGSPCCTTRNGGGMGPAPVDMLGSFTVQRGPLVPSVPARGPERARTQSLDTSDELVHDVSELPALPCRNPL